MHDPTDPAAGTPGAEHPEPPAAEPAQPPAAEPARPPHAERARPADPLLGRALALVRYLREGCPWDARQDPLSLRPYLLEEAHEVAEAIAAGDDAALARELGDLLLNVAFQVVLAEERAAFDAESVVSLLEAKMRARHPHIYGDAEEPPDWEELKAREKRAAGDADPFEGVAAGLDPLSRALRIQDRAGALGFEWPGAGAVLEKLREELAELEPLVEGRSGGRRARPEGHARDRLEEELGDLLFAAVALARVARVHPANALLGATAKFERRFRAARALAVERGVAWEEAGPDELLRLWREAKAPEGHARVPEEGGS